MTDDVCCDRNPVGPGFLCTKKPGHMGGHAWVDGVRRGVPNSAWPNLGTGGRNVWDWVGFVLVGMLMVSWAISTVGLAALVFGGWKP